MAVCRPSCGSTTFENTTARHLLCMHVRKSRRWRLEHEANRWRPAILFRSRSRCIPDTESPLLTDYANHGKPLQPLLMCP